MDTITLGVIAVTSGILLLAGCQQAGSGERMSRQPADESEDKGYMIAHMDDIEAVKCPCGMSKRAFVTPDNDVATLHVVDIAEDARAHYHKKMTEIYYILETRGDAYMELNGKLVPVKPNTTVFIKPYTRHRAVGDMKIINVPVPAFDPDDEYFD
jgi:mannose-6-phosphate isomerase-like protein (cupin superfamily)